MLVETDVRPARRATAIVFLLTGGVFASWGTRIPAIQDELGLSPGELSIAILGIEGGAVLGLPAGGALAARLGSRASLRIGFVLYCGAMALVGLAPSLPALTAALALTAMGTSVNDVAMNVQGVELERRAGRPVLSGLHSAHSFGVLGSALIGTLAAAVGLGVEPHFLAVAVVALVAGLLASRRLVDEPRARGGPLLARPRGALVALAAIAFCGFLIEGAAIQWSAVHLRSEHGAQAGLAAAAFAAFALAIAISRLFGDRVVARRGRAAVLRWSGILAAAGAVVAITAPGAAAAVGGWALLGAGVALVAPTVLGAAPDASDGVPAPVAIAAVTTIGYLGSFTGPPLIGAVAEVGSLPAGLLLVVAAAAAIALIRPRSG